MELFQGGTSYYTRSHLRAKQGTKTRFESDSVGAILFIFIIIITLTINTVSTKLVRLTTVPHCIKNATFDRPCLKVCISCDPGAMVIDGNWIDRFTGVGGIRLKQWVASLLLLSSSERNDILAL